MINRTLYKLYKYKEPGSARGIKKQVYEMQWWSRDRVLEWQWTQVKELLEHAQKAVPYYQRLFRELGIEAKDIRTWDDFARLPILTKEDIQRNPKLLLASGAQAMENHTSGSTGQILRFYQDVDYFQWAHASLAWGFNLCGFQGGEKQVFIWGSDYDARPHKTLKGRLINRVQNIRFIDALNITDHQLKKLAEELSRRKPDYIWGYVSSVELLADQILKDGIELHPKGVQTTAGTLHPSVREKLELVFGKVIFDRYGSREVSIAAHECSEHQGLHVASFHNYVEIVGGDNSRIGKIVITNLHNKAFPFIRYEVGDLGIPENRICTCGRSFPLLKCVVGRTREVITSPSGKLIDGGFFVFVFFKVKGVKRFQVVQESTRQLVIKVVKAEDFKLDILPFLEGEIKQHGDPQFDVQFEIVDHIPDLSPGKRAYVLSKVPVRLA